jgi:hypothetical protein
VHNDMLVITAYQNGTDKFYSSGSPSWLVYSNQ